MRKTMSLALLALALAGCQGGPSSDAKEASADKQPASRWRTVGAFYHPGPGKADEIRTMTEADPGGRRGFSHAIAPIVRFDSSGHREVWRDYVKASADVDEGRLKCVLDAHVLVGPKWTEDDRAYDLLLKIAESSLAKHVGGFYVADEPFGRSHPDRKNPVDIAQIWDLVQQIRRVEKRVGRRFRIFANYAAVLPLLRKGGDPVNGGFADYTGNRERREVFLWRGKWVQKVVEKSTKGRVLVRGYGFFGEDVSIINWWNDVRHLRRWKPRIASEISFGSVHIGLGWDHSEDTPDNNQKWIERTKKLIQFGDEMGVGGYWFWAWQTIPIPSQKRVYKGLSSWWLTDERDGVRRERYAALIESIK